MEERYSLVLRVDQTTKKSFGPVPGFADPHTHPLLVIVPKALTIVDPQGNDVDWEKQVEPHLLQLVQVAKDCKRVENVFSSLDWGASERSGVFKSRQQALGRCQTVLTHSSPKHHATFAAEAIAKQHTLPVAVEAMSVQATETGDHTPSELQKKYDRLDPDLVAPALKKGVPAWILSFLNVCVGQVVQFLCHSQLTPMKGSLMFFDPEGDDVVHPQPAHIDYDPAQLYYSGGVRNGPPRVLPASVFIFSFSKEYNLYWWKDFCGPDVLEKIAEKSPFGDKGPCARSAMDWRTDPAFINSTLNFGDLLWCDGSMVHAGASYYDAVRRPVFRLHVFACSRDGYTANILSEQVDNDTFFVQYPGRLSSTASLQESVPPWLQSHLKKDASMK